MIHWFDNISALIANTQAAAASADGHAGGSRTDGSFEAVLLSMLAGSNQVQTAEVPIPAIQTSASVTAPEAAVATHTVPVLIESITAETNSGNAAIGAAELIDTDAAGNEIRVPVTVRFDTTGGENGPSMLTVTVDSEEEAQHLARLLTAQDQTTVLTLSTGQLSETEQGTTDEITLSIAGTTEADQDRTDGMPENNSPMGQVSDIPQIIITLISAQQTKSNEGGLPAEISAAVGSSDSTVDTTVQSGQPARASNTETASRLSYTAAAERPAGIEAQPVQPPTSGDITTADTPAQGSPQKQPAQSGAQPYRAVHPAETTELAIPIISVKTSESNQNVNADRITSTVPGTDTQILLTTQGTEAASPIEPGVSAAKNTPVETGYSAKSPQTKHVTDLHIPVRIEIIGADQQGPEAENGPVILRIAIRGNESDAPVGVSDNQAAAHTSDTVRLVRLGSRYVSTDTSTPVSTESDTSALTTSLIDQDAHVTAKPASVSGTGMQANATVKQAEAAETKQATVSTGSEPPGNGSGQEKNTVPVQATDTQPVSVEQTAPEIADGKAPAAAPENAPVVRTGAEPANGSMTLETTGEPQPPQSTVQHNPDASEHVTFARTETPVEPSAANTKEPVMVNLSEQEPAARVNATRNTTSPESRTDTAVHTSETAISVTTAAQTTESVSGDASLTQLAESTAGGTAGPHRSATASGSDQEVSITNTQRMSGNHRTVSKTDDVPAPVEATVVSEQNARPESANMNPGNTGGDTLARQTRQSIPGEQHTVSVSNHSRPSANLSTSDTIPNPASADNPVTATGAGTVQQGTDTVIPAAMTGSQHAAPSDTGRHARTAHAEPQQSGETPAGMVQAATPAVNAPAGGEQAGTSLNRERFGDTGFDRESVFSEPGGERGLTATDTVFEVPPAVSTAESTADTDAAHSARMTGGTATRFAAADPAAVTNAIVRQANIMVRNGESSAEIRLEPPSLGKMKLDIVTESGKITGKITVESAEIRDLVQQNLPQLRESLAENGLKVQSFDVQVGHNGGTDSWARRETAQQLAGTARPGAVNGTGSDAGTAEMADQISARQTVSLETQLFDKWI